MSRLIARTPTKFWTRHNFVWKNIPIPPDEPLEVTESDAQFFWLIQKNAMEMILNDYNWDTVDCDIYEFMLRLLVALVMHERKKRAEEKPLESQVRLELRDMLLVPTTDVVSIQKRIHVAENEGRTISFAQACERGGIDREKLIFGDEFFRATMYADVMDPDVLHNLYKSWKKNKLMRVLPSVLREQYEKEAEEPEDAVRRMMATDPGWMQWTSQMHSQVHDTMGNLQPQKKLKMLEGTEQNKPKGKPNNKAANVSNTNQNFAQESKPANFDNMLTNILSSTAVDQAAEELYRRSQAQTDAVAELGRARGSNNAPSNHLYGNGHGPTNGNGVHAIQHPGALEDPLAGGLGLNDISVDVRNNGPSA